MVRSALFVSLLATISGVIARGSGQTSKVVPGAYIFEFENDQVSLAQPLALGTLPTAVANADGTPTGHGRFLQAAQRRGLNSHEVQLQAVQGCLSPTQGPLQP